MNKNKIFQEWFIVTDNESGQSQLPTHVVDCPLFTYMQFKDAGFEFVVANSITGDVFHFRDGQNLEYEKDPTFCYDKRAKELLQCEPTVLEV